VNSHRKGSSWRRQVELWLQAAGFSTSVRGLGFSGDDIVASRQRVVLSVEAKNHRAVDLAAFVDQAERQAAAGLIPVLVLHRRGRASVDDGYVVLSGRSFLVLVDAVVRNELP
jgi:hypothetical protein